MLHMLLTSQTVPVVHDAIVQKKGQSRVSPKTSAYVTRELFEMRLTVLLLDSR